MPMNPKDYPPNWKEISHFVRKVRAEDRCECRGECGSKHLGGLCDAPNKTMISRNIKDPARWVQEVEFFGRDVGEWAQAIKIVLTTAHLCHNSKCDKLEHLRAMCQRCLRYDRYEHGKKASTSRRRNRDKATGQKSLFKEGA